MVMNWLLKVFVRILQYFRLYQKVKFGHLDIVGSGNVSIDLDIYKNVLDVRFDDDNEDCHIMPPPCGGGLPDMFEWEVKKNHLNISWSVQRPRRLMWVASTR